MGRPERARLPAALWEGCEDNFYLRVELAGMPLPRWVCAGYWSRASPAGFRSLKPSSICRRGLMQATQRRTTWTFARRENRAHSGCKSFVSTARADVLCVARAGNGACVLAVGARLHGGAGSVGRRAPEHPGWVDSRPSDPKRVTWADDYPRGLSHRNHAISREPVSTERHAAARGVHQASVFYCAWGLFPGSLTEESSPFNEWPRRASRGFVHVVHDAIIPEQARGGRWGPVAERYRARSR